MRKNQQIEAQLAEAGLSWNEAHNCYSNDTHCIAGVAGEEQYRIGRMEEGTPVYAEGTHTLEEALASLQETV